MRNINALAAQYNIKVNNKEIDQSIKKRITEINVVELIDEPSSFIIKINGAKEEFIDISNGIFREGSLVEIIFGNLNKDLSRLIITGEISSIMVDFVSMNTINLTIIGYDLLHRMTRGNTLRIFNGEVNSDYRIVDLVEELTNDVNMKLVSDILYCLSYSITQKCVTNKEILDEIARKFGLHYWAKGKTLYLKDGYPVIKDNKLEFKYGKNLLGFSCEVSTYRMVKNVGANVINLDEKVDKLRYVEEKLNLKNYISDLAMNQLDYSSGKKSIEYIDIEDFSIGEDEAKDIINSRIKEIIYNYFVGNGICLGNPDIQLGSIVELSGTGRFNGEYVVTKVENNIDSNGYKTNFEVRIRYENTAK